MKDIYVRLARHLEPLVLGHPYSDALPAPLREIFTETDAEVALAIPSKGLAPLETTEADAIFLVRHTESEPPGTFRDPHTRIRLERGVG